MKPDDSVPQNQVLGIEVGQPSFSQEPLTDLEWAKNLVQRWAQSQDPEDRTDILFELDAVDLQGHLSDSAPELFRLQQLKRILITLKLEGRTLLADELSALGMLLAEVKDESYRRWHELDPANHTKDNFPYDNEFRAAETKIGAELNSLNAAITEVFHFQESGTHPRPLPRNVAAREALERQQTSHKSLLSQFLACVGCRR
jgi:hypothetical protein